ncbi:phosphotransferase family protein [Nocardiopsis suaedae]|uniref:Aminoglycoside phosphotransferase family protein n=1 Tax=Nocardiopsis suaedae TaxID=3018444 RepID=A0ABT4TP88_9ACTN|nr:aminoglycoside phosphotransferase family protein [Nocardiopsis suaedae]MDA2806488.1 aminoglycoside phosphotransferase family protein [Nocardiopsis suaedae]
MNTASAPAILEWVRDTAGPGARVPAEPRRVGVASTTLDAVDVIDGGGTRHAWMVRRFHDRARLADDPWYRPESEAAVLRLLKNTGVRAPALHAADPDGSRLGVPALLTDRVPGHADWDALDPAAVVEDLARELAAIHAVGGSARGGADAGLALLPEYRPYYDPGEHGPLGPHPWSDARLWERVFTVLDGPAPDVPHTFIHRDYHPGQALWVDGRLSGIVDWLTGCRGPQAVDLARMRLNLAQGAGPEAERSFLAAHRRITGGDAHHPYWDLVDATDFMLWSDPPEDGEERRAWSAFESWTAHALAELG